MQSQAQVSEQQAQINQTQQRLRSLRTLYPLEQIRLERTEENVQRYQILSGQGAVSRIELYRAEEERDERNKILEQLASDIQQTESELGKQQSAYERIGRTGELTILESERQIKELQSGINLSRDSLCV